MSESELSPESDKSLGGGGSGGAGVPPVPSPPGGGGGVPLVSSPGGGGDFVFLRFNVEVFVVGIFCSDVWMVCVYPVVVYNVDILFLLFGFGT